MGDEGEWGCVEVGFLMVGSRKESIRDHRRVGFSHSNPSFRVLKRHCETDCCLSSGLWLDARD